MENLQEKAEQNNKHEDCGGTWILKGEILDEFICQCDKCKDVELD